MMTCNALGRMEDPLCTGKGQVVAAVKITNIVVAVIVAGAGDIIMTTILNREYFTVKMHTMRKHLNPKG